jgi:hypothetical protein
MQKKILWGVAALVLLFVFAGCSQPTDFTYSGASPGNPGSLKADVSYEGLVLLTWDPVINAKEYEIYRYDTVDKTPRKLLAKPDRGATFYPDFVGENNQLVDGRSYEYTVVAVNNSFDGGAMPLKNGSSKVSAKPKIPEKGSELTANLDVTVGEAGDFILVTINNGQPNLSYSVGYAYGESILYWQTAFDWTAYGNGVETGGNEWIFEKTKYIRFLKAGGTNTVTVEYGFAGDQDGGFASYYSGGTAITQTITTSVGGSLPDIENFAVQREPEYAILSWDYDAAHETFDIYKAEVSSDPNFVAPWDTTDPTINFISDWEKVNVNPQAAGAKVIAKEALSSATKKYVYVIIAKNADGASSAPAYTYEVEANYQTPQISVRSRSDDPAAAEITWGLSQALGWSQEGATYKLERIKVDPVTYGGDVTLTPPSFEAVGEYENVPIATADYVLDFAVVIDKPEVDQSYLYRLTATRYGITAAPTFAILTTTVFNKNTNFTLSAYEGNDLANNAHYLDRALKIQYTGESAADKDRTIVLYRRKVTGGGDSTPWSQINSRDWTKGTDFYIVQDSVPDVSWSYEYRIEVDPGVDSIGRFNASGAKSIGGAGLTPVRAYGYGYELNNTGSAKNAIDVRRQDLGVTYTWSSTYEWPLKSGMIVIDSGAVSTDIVAIDGDQSANNGPSIEGMTIRVKYAIFDGIGATPKAISSITGADLNKYWYGSDEKDCVVQKLTSTAMTDIGPTGTTSNGQNTVFYLYYIQLPPTTAIADAADGEPTYGLFNNPPAASDPDPAAGDIPKGAFNDDDLLAVNYEWGTTTVSPPGDDKLNIKKN